MHFRIGSAIVGAMSDSAKRPSMPSTPSTPLDESRRHRKKQRTRREIYDAAMALFAERGFDEVTLTQICDSADISRATFFLHFRNKAALLFEFERRVVEDFTAGLSDPRGTAHDEIRALTEYIDEQLAASARIMGAMVREFLLTPVVITDSPTESDSLLALVEGIIARGQRDGEFALGVAPNLAAASYLLTAAAIIRIQLAGESGIPIHDECRQLLQMTFSGLGVSGDGKPA